MYRGALGPLGLGEPGRQQQEHSRLQDLAAKAAKAKHKLQTGGCVCGHAHTEHMYRGGCLWCYWVGARFGLSWGALDFSWGLLALSCGFLGLSNVLLGWGPFWTILGGLGPLLGSLGALLWLLGAVCVAIGLGLVLGSLGGPCVSLGVSTCV
jgi:hypothetical protein